MNIKLNYQSNLPQVGISQINPGDIFMYGDITYLYIQYQWSGKEHIVLNLHSHEIGYFGVDPVSVTVIKRNAKITIE